MPELSPIAITAMISAFVLITVLVAVVSSGLRSRRRLGNEVREIVEGLEQLRSGRPRPRPEVESTSPMGVVADALHRLGHDLNARWSEAENAAERWRALIDASGDVAVITTDNDGDIRSFSPGAQGLFGWEEGDVLSRPAAVVFDESSYKDLLPKLARRTLRQSGIQTQCKLLRRDGSSFDAEVSVRSLMTPASHPLGFMMVVRDITEQVRMARQLRESEERYRGLVEGLAEGVVIVREGRVVYTNPAAEHLCGCARNELEDTPWRDRVATRDVLVMEEALAELERQPGAAQELRCTLVGRHGEARAEVRFKASSLQYGGAPSVLLLIHDETSERRIDAELRRNEARLDAVLEATSDGILVLSEERHAGAVQMTNRAFARLFDLRMEEVLGASEAELTRLLSRRGDGAGQLAEWIARGTRGDTKIGVSVGADPGRDLEISMSVLTGRDGERLGRVLACRDVTEQRRSERELQEQAERLQLSKIELEQSYTQLNDVNKSLGLRGEELSRLNEELRRLDEMKSNLLGNVSHELQTPLVSIRGYTEMILKERLGPISDEQRKGLELSLKNIDRLIAMIDNLLAFNRTDSEMTRLELTVFELRPLVDEAADLLRSEIASRNLTLKVTIDDPALIVRADRNKVLQVLLNLIANAVKFNREGGSVEVSALRGRSGYATVRVRDTGIGIPAASLGRVFDRHYQARQPQSVGTAGSGIGLAIVRDILRLHGCTIQVDSKEHEGTEFTFTLPLGEQEREAAPDATAPSGEAGSRALRPRLRIIRPETESDA